MTPVFFISHGAPTFALEPGLLGPQLSRLGKNLQNVQAVLIVSAHWQTQRVGVMTTLQPKTIHDFGGFSPELYELHYDANGHPQLAKQAAQLLQAAGFSVELDAQRGLDHGAWVPLMHLLPQAKAPVFQVSMPFTLNTADAYKLGQALAPLREQGVVIMGSGSVTHNLAELHSPDAPAQDYALAFEAWTQHAVRGNQTDQLIAYRSQAPQAARAHPSEEHYLPLLVAMGARNDADAVQVLDGGITYGVLSMQSFVWSAA